MQTHQADEVGSQHEEAAAAAAAAADQIDPDAAFGIEEGEVDQLEKKWITWSYDVEENKRLVLDEVDDVGATPQRLSVWGAGSPSHGGGSRARRSSAWAERLVAASPVFYGWVIAALVGLSGLLVSPVQVFTVGAVADAMIVDLQLTRLQLSGLYAVAALLSAPLITLLPLMLRRISRRLLVTLCGAILCLGLLLLASSGGQIGLLFSWLLLQVRAVAAQPLDASTPDPRQPADSPTPQRSPHRHFARRLSALGCSILRPSRCCSSGGT
jgi:hypothetical protein